MQAVGQPGKREILNVTKKFLTDESKKFTKMKILSSFTDTSISRDLHPQRKSSHHRQSMETSKQASAALHTTEMIVRPRCSTFVICGMSQ